MGENISQALTKIIRKTHEYRAEDIALVRAMGFEVDDNNKPAPGNIPDQYIEQLTMFQLMVMQ